MPVIAHQEGDLAVGGTREDRVREQAREALRAVTVREGAGNLAWRRWTQ